MRPSNTGVPSRTGAMRPPRTLPLTAPASLSFPRSSHARRGDSPPSKFTRPRTVELEIFSKKKKSRTRRRGGKEGSNVDNAGWAAGCLGAQVHSALHSARRQRRVVEQWFGFLSTTLFFLNHGSIMLLLPNPIVGPC